MLVQSAVEVDHLLQTGSKIGVFDPPFGLAREAKERTRLGIAIAADPVKLRLEIGVGAAVEAVAVNNGLIGENPADDEPSEVDRHGGGELGGSFEDDAVGTTRDWDVGINGACPRAGTARFGETLASQWR